MKVTEWQRHLGIGSGPYARFMKLKDPHSGAGNQTFEAAYMFFKRRERKGRKIPQKKAKKDVTAGLDVSDIHLDGEEDNAVKVYETCDEMRHKISAFLRRDGVTQAFLVRQLRDQYHPPKPIQSKQFSDFRAGQGPLGRNTNCCYYASYVYFEKLRLKEKKPKSKMRQETEKVYARGIDTKTPTHNRGILCGPGEYPVEDKFGGFDIIRGGPKPRMSRKTLT